MMNPSIAFCLLPLLTAIAALPSQGRPRLMIAGGYATNPNELPYQVSIQYYGMHTCGGTVYNSRYIITAAHCVDGDPAFAFEVVAGEHNLSRVDGTEQRRKVASIVVHEKYSGYSYGYDIALLRVSKPLELNHAVQSLPLPPQGHQATGDAIISGWGSLSPQGALPEVLNQVTVTVFSDAECRKAYGSDMTDTMICAGDTSGGKDSCRGDSGGPLVAADLGYKYLAGIVSWGISCALPSYPGVYSKVSFFTNWIQAQADLNLLIVK